MSNNDSLLSTKLILPRRHDKLVHRQRLFEKLGVEPQPLSLICAPAGFGKTTLLTSWLEQQEKPIAWLSLGEGDNDPAHFLRYLIETIQRVFPQFGKKEAAMLALPQAPNVISLLRSLVNQINNVDVDFFLALDDYHVIENDAVHEALNYLIENQPHTLHVAMTSRSAPPVALPRMRVRRQLVEIGETELRFTHEEAAQFLNNITGLNLSSSDISVLEARTEGWIAGLQLAAISLEDEENKASFIQAFAGDDRYIMDYLTDEVLQRQPPEIKQYLLQTSILERLNGSLCDVVADTSGSAETLAQLEQSNMFLIPLDNKRNWYRYHHLFADLLREQLSRNHPEQLPSLHYKASNWFNDNGLPHEAIKHALEAGDFEQAAKVINQHGQRLFDEGQAPTLMTWYQQLPDSIIRSDPCHMLRCAWCHFIGCGEVLHDLVAELQQLFDANELELADEQRIMMEIDLSLMGGFKALQQREISLAKEHAERAMQCCLTAGMADVIPPRLLLASACFAHAELDKAGDLFRTLIDNAFTNEYLIALNTSICGLGRVLTRQGKLQAARDQLSNDLQRLREKGWDEYLMDTAWIHLALSELAYQGNELDQCLMHLEKAKAAAYQDTWETLPAMVDIRLAKTNLAKGEQEAADKCIAAINLEKIKPSLFTFFPSVEDDLFAVQLSQGDLSQADQWLSRKGLHGYNEPAPDQEWENILFVRLLIRQHHPEQALTLLTPLLLTAEQKQHRTALIELLVLQALARQAQGKTRQAIESLERALGYAENEKHIRVFLDEGAPMAALLKRALKGSHADYVQNLLKQMGDEPSLGRNDGSLIEPLSSKERKTLELLITGLSNKEIAEQLFVSPNTVKTHVKNIYRKLSVNNRVEAVSKGSSLVELKT
ncbi:MAG: LuxR C-terminal-related transcriptional regulator [Gammaproteobacteria bacterium]